MSKGKNIILCNKLLFPFFKLLIVINIIILLWCLRFLLTQDISLLIIIVLKIKYKRLLTKIWAENINSLEYVTIFKKFLHLIFLTFNNELSIKSWRRLLKKWRMRYIFSEMVFFRVFSLRLLLRTYCGHGLWSRISQKLLWIFSSG